jgi:uncharacterized membrane protein YbhN (UPF0104 family)
MTAPHPVETRPDPQNALALARRWGPRLLPVLLLAGAAYVLWRQLHHLSIQELARALAAWGPWRIGASVIFCLLSYLTLALNEWAGLRWAGRPLSLKAVLYGSFCANAFGHSLGSAVVVGAAVRLRTYAPYRVSLADIIKTTAFCNVSFALGLAVIAGWGLVQAPASELHAVHLAPWFARLVGGLFLGSIPAYVAACAVLRGPLRILGHSFLMPSAGWALAQVAIGVVDNILTVLIVWILLPSGSVGLSAFTGAFAVATFTGIVSAVPAGAGVFEGVVLTLLPHAAKAPLAAAFVGYRLFYYLIPLAFAGAMMLLQRRDKAA